MVSCFSLIFPFRWLPLRGNTHVYVFTCSKGILDQGTGMLVLREDPYNGQDHKVALDIVHTLSASLDLLFQKAKKLA